MKYLYLWLFLLMNTAGFTQDLNFQTTQGGYTAGALTMSYNGIGYPPTSVTVSTSGATAYLNTNSPQAFSNGLQLATNHSVNTTCLTITITFNPAVQGLSFKLFNVDRGAGTGPTYNYVDQVTVNGQYSTAIVSPTINASGTAGNYSNIAGNIITGIGDAPSAGTDPGNVVTFTDVVSSITIQYCNNASQTIANPTGQAVTIGSLSWNATPMPVNLVSFQGKVIGNQVALNWETAWEQNNDYFEIQRSANASEFVSIDRIEGSNQSSTRLTYSTLDQQPLMGVNYYRLKQVDRYGGSVAYSSIIAVVVDDLTSSLSILGNPVDGQSIVISHRNIDLNFLRLLTTTGEQLSYRLQAESPVRTVVIPNHWLSPGVYLLSTGVGPNTQILKVVVR